MWLKSSNAQTSLAPPSAYGQFNQTVLKRSTRAVLFPKGASVLLTPSFTKAILDGRPKGLTSTIEFDMYHPLPDTVAGWQPTILVNKIQREKEAALAAELAAAKHEAEIAAELAAKEEAEKAAKAQKDSLSHKPEFEEVLNYYQPFSREPQYSEPLPFVPNFPLRRQWKSHKKSPVFRKYISSSTFYADNSQLFLF